MPELPEVETVRRYLAQVLPGKTVRWIKVLAAKQFPQPATALNGRAIVGVERKGKQLAIIFDNGKVLLIHLKLTGQLIYAPHLQSGARAVFGHPIPFAGGNSLPGRSTRVIISLAGAHGKAAGTLFFNDVRMFGWLRLMEKSQWEEQMAKLGADALSSEFSAGYLYQVLQSTRRPVKIVLMDQQKISGIGNIYANEALYQAGIDPRRPANSLSRQEAQKLWRAVRNVLRESLKMQGTTAADDAYIQPDGQPGRFQQKLAVYQRAGQKCPRGDGIIKRVELGGRGTFFCPHCQK